MNRPTVFSVYTVKFHNCKSNNDSRCVETIVNKIAKAINETYAGSKSMLPGSEYVLYESLDFRALNPPARQLTDSACVGRIGLAS